MSFGRIDLGFPNQRSSDSTCWLGMVVNYIGSVGSSSVRRSAGILTFRHSGRKPMVLLVHPGGPFWRNKDRNSWSIPKGEFGDDEAAEAAAEREFEEETGFRPAGALLPLGEAIQGGGKGSQRLPWLAISMPTVSRAYLAKSNGHRRVDGSSASPRWTARNGLRSTTRGTRSSRDKASFSIAWNKSCGRCHRSEGRLYPSSSG